ncbi:C4b-binding protein alpha chain-like [Perognathus longimembris pacificus]|uniref:C4b-binding protein alpha chain-like n=1 Tax=Perognathus longimembris pacificus TaxID=214514 RepID=UPI002019614D|nr:C4b-binding protein alpha chain-like [Perognathus longimembris pacificus]
MISEESRQERSRHRCSQPSSAIAAAEKMAAWLFPRLSSVSDPSLFRITLVTTLLATVLGKCGPPPNLAFALPVKKVDQEDFDTQTVLKYTCRLGYSRIRSNSDIVCRGDGTWEYDEFCVKKRCQNPGDLRHGQVEIQTDFSFGSQIHFSCSEGYILHGSTTSFCEIQNKGVGWSNPLPECVSVKCEPPPAISNGKHGGGDEDIFTYGSSVTYGCNPNFSLIGNATIFCSVVNQTIGVWSPDPPTCKKINCPQPDVPHGKIISGFAPIYTYKHSIMFTCQNGFALRGSSVILCEADGNWNPSPPTCEIKSCLGRPDIPHASWTDYYNVRREGVYYPGDMLVYRCDSGYKPAINGPTSVICQRDFKWSPFNGCKKVCCPVPSLQNVITTYRTEAHFDTGCTYVYEDVVSYTCYGEKMFSATCQADGTWHPRTPSCLHNCRFPPKIAHGEFELSSTFLGRSTKATYTCEEGYSLVGEATLTCGDLLWSPAAPECKAQCEKPQIEHGKVFVNKAQYVEPENVTIHCDSGFSVVGPQSITCSENGTWYPKVPKCEWDAPEGCKQVLQGRKLMQCLPSAEEVKMALEIYKLSLEIELLESQRDKAR